MDHAVHASVSFFSKTVPQFPAPQQDDDVSAEEVSIERKSVQQIRSVLKKYQEAAKE
jgi:hypothetical protein